MSRYRVKEHWPTTRKVTSLSYNHQSQTRTGPAFAQYDEHLAAEDVIAHFVPQRWSWWSGWTTLPWRYSDICGAMIKYEAPSEAEVSFTTYDEALHHIREYHGQTGIFERSGPPATIYHKVTL